MSYKPFPELTKADESKVSELLSQWSLANGLVMYPPNFKTYSAAIAPTTLFPTPFPRSAFQNAVDVQQSFNELYTNLVANHKEWLIEVITQLSQHDVGFTGKLFEAYNKAVEESPNKELVQPLSLGVFRNDFMIDNQEASSTPGIKQIEFNTVSVSFGALSTKVGQLHNYLNKFGVYGKNYYSNDELPISTSIDELADSLAEADSHYKKQQSVDDSIILFIVQPNERNCFDQRHIEYSLINNHSIKSVRLTLEEIESQVEVRNSDQKLFIKATSEEVSVVYFRSGYGPSDYDLNPELTWNARVILEKSAAIKCPSLLTQLSGSKKIQQILTKKEIVKKILPSITEEDLSKLLSTFVAIYPLDDTEEGKLAKKLAFEHPERFVLKPQREGGGNNIYKANIPGFLKSIDEKEWDAYILMELINPPTHKNKLIRNDEIYNEDIVSELGIFGTILFDEQKGGIISNKNAGFLLRSKFSSSDEGGVAAGFGCVDNVYLY
ncbi:glutathione synthase [Suhomyces tanzawaensis NRRL Y-17324]|uniref:Glutathione synthetase n=1 Tax=Suhomyces tanzawaensis NRRL Y-17324 TaxID=984487 RepID=A0A1E4SLC9_9ASCO|nr:glutathione synthase [Suhomyces tanzawaensis NRRL Y-17324]ODV80306.1 glutathione synthase [Suhomyces tanzawaensis NRRL Y-17324]